MMGWCSVPVARAYAFALYVDESAVECGSGAASDVLSHMMASKAANPAQFTLSLRLKMARSIDGPHISKGFVKSLSKKLHALPADALKGDEFAQLKSFVSTFDSKNFDTGGAHPTLYDPISCVLVLP